MNEKLQQQIVQLVQAAMQGNQEANQQIQQIAQAAQQGNQQALQLYQYIQAVAQQLQGRTPSQKSGGKLDYLKSLKNMCKEDEELVYMKSGDKVYPVCTVCQKKKQVQTEKCGGAVKEFKAKYDKCGGKMKKKEDGGKFPKSQKPLKPSTQKIPNRDPKFQGGGYFSKVKENVTNAIGKAKRTVEYAEYNKPTKDGFPYNEAKHKELLEKFRKNPKGMTKQQMDSLRKYNRKDPNQEGV